MREKINENQESINILKKNKRIGLVGAVSCIIIFFILLINRDLIHGLMLISYPILLGLSIFFGKIGLTGKIKDGLKYLCFILTLVLIIVFYFLIITIRHGFGPGLADFTYQINNECLLTRTSAHMIMIGCSNIEKSIGPEVTSLGWDDNYIVASTHPTSDENNAIIVPTPNSSITYWWILDLKNKTQYGPFNTEAKYNAKKDELKISDINLLSVDEAKTRATWINGDFRD